MSDAWICRCTAKNAEGARYCEACGAEHRPAPRPRAAPGPPARAAPAPPPTYPELTAEDDVARRAALEAIFALLGGRPVRAAPPRALPAIDPAIRAEVERRGPP